MKFIQTSPAGRPMQEGGRFSRSSFPLTGWRVVLHFYAAEAGLQLGRKPNDCRLNDVVVMMGYVVTKVHVRDTRAHGLGDCVVRCIAKDNYIYIPLYGEFGLA